MYSKYNGPNANGQPKPYITKDNFIDLMPEEAFYEMKSMLFDSVDSTVIVDFLMRVREFSAEYRVQVSDAVRSIVTMRDSKECGIRKRKQFDAARSLGGGSGCGGRPIVVKESVFQLVPGVSSSACSGVKQAVWRHGYWHIARSQVCVWLLLMNLYFLLSITVTKLIIRIPALDSDIFYLSNMPTTIFIFYLQINLGSSLVFHQSTPKEQRTRSTAALDSPSTLSKKIHNSSINFTKNFIHFVSIAHITCGYQYLHLFSTANI